MTPFQQLYLGMGAKKKTYMDDVFSTYLYKGNSTGVSNQAINNGIDLSGEGGMVWIKQRTGTYSHNIIDTVRGSNKRLQSNSNSAENTATGYVSQFNSNGLNVGTSAQTNYDGESFSSWTFRKAPGFFDIVTYTGNDTSGRSISHSLGSIPGCIMVKCTSHDSHWRVYHQGNATSTVAAEHWALSLNQDVAATDGPQYFNDTPPTSTHFTVGNSSNVNSSGRTYVAYLFAGGESTAATARSVDFDGNGDQLIFAESSSGIALGTGNFTCEFWVKLNGATTGNDALIDTRSTGSASDGFQLYLDTNRQIYGYVSGDMFGSGGGIPIGQWTHIAVVRAASTATKLYVNGIHVGSTYTGSQDFSNSDIHVAANSALSTETNCKISNLRLTKGQALYTSSFKPPTEPLTTTSQGATSSNVKILACNNSSTTGGTVVTSTVQEYGQPTASTDSPFDDPAAFTFGENGDQGIIKCGSYEGSGGAQDIYLGWEPQYILFKDADAAENWNIYDSMRGIDTHTTSNGDKLLNANSTTAETGGDAIDVTPTGFKITSGAGGFGGSGKTHVYMAIRRPDGYVNKPAEAGTDVLAITSGGSSVYSSGFPVDFAFYKNITNTEHWYASARLIQGKEFKFNSTDAQTNWTGATFDSNDSWGTSVQNSSHRSWMFKRHKGFDTVAYQGNGVNGRDLPHSLSQTPEMIWTKNREQTDNWVVWHNGLTVTPLANAWIPLNATSAQDTANNHYGSSTATLPTSTHWTVGNADPVNKSGENYISMLFSSVDGISKVGSYTGTGANQTITTGFQPKFILVRRVNTTQYWAVLDTNRGWDGTNDPELYLNESSAGNTVSTATPTSTGFTITSTSATWNNNGDKYIYYAHA